MWSKYIRAKIAGTSPFVLGMYWFAGLAFLSLYFLLFSEHEFSDLRLGFYLFSVIGTVMLGSTVMGVLFSDLKTSRRMMATQMAKLRDFESLASRWATHDELTGLMGRGLSKSVGRTIVDEAIMSHKKVAVVFLDINDFRRINEGLGEAGGDFVLAHVASALKDFASFGDVVSRQGGDEFLMVLNKVGSEKLVCEKLKMLMNKLSMAVVYEGRKLYVYCSIGVSMLNDPGDSLDSLIKKASSACKHAKQIGGNSVRFFSSTMEMESDELNTVTQLQEAVDRKEFNLEYQPFFDLKTMKLTGCEALIRWNHPENGRVQPGVFIPLAERTGLICEIGAWVIQEVCRQLKEWSDTDYKDVIVAINLSAAQFKRDDLVETIAKAIRENGVNPGLLEFEVTESALIDDADSFVKTLGEIKALGVRLSIDDFGTGYSNLSYLRRFDIDKLKIDRSFVSGLCDSSNDGAIVKAIIQMGHGLGLSVTAEGVEDKETLEELKRLGCDIGQGFHYARPRVVSDFESFFDSEKSR